MKRRRTPQPSARDSAHAESARERLALQRLSWFALQQSTSALAMFREGRVVVSNARWQALASARGGALGWSVGVRDELVEYDDLATLAMHQLRNLEELLRPVTLRVRRRGSGQVLRMRFERVARKEDEYIGLVLADDVTDELARDSEMGELRRDALKKEQMTALGRLAAGVAHDLGNTVNALALRVAQLRGDNVVDHAPLDAIDEAVALMRSTLDRLNRFAGSRSRTLVPVDLRAVIAAAIGMAGLRSGRRTTRSPVVVAVKLPKKLPRVLADASELTNVFVNLLVNARDAMPGGGRVTVEGKATARRVTVRVCDEGPGFPPDQLHRVFEPFFTTKGAHGSGLGLSLAYGFMQAIGGAIEAGNRAPHGAEIVLELPVSDGRSVLDARGRVAGGLDVRARRKRLQ